MDIREHNRIAWDALAEKGDRWTVPVSREAIEAARKGVWEAQIGGQIAAGFAITGMYEDIDTSEDGYALNRFMPTFIATRAVKPAHA
jgi:hypothetical protein